MEKMKVKKKQEITEKELNNMMCLDIYLSSLSIDDQAKIKHRIAPTKEKTNPLFCWDIASVHNNDLLTLREKQREIENLNRQIRKLDCHLDFEFMLNKSYTALVLTDTTQVILWVSKGFTEMTGYPSKFAIGKRPAFLQGPNTAEETKVKIERQLAEKSTFKETIVNYKRDKTEYYCEIEIYPIKDHQDKIGAFLALETEVL